MPIAYDFHRRGFFYTRTVEGFPNAPQATDTEIFALAVAHKTIAQYRGLPLQKPLDAGFKKLLRRVGGVTDAQAEKLLSAVSFRSAGMEEVAPRVISTITKAVTDQHALTFCYRRPGDQEARQRHVLPYHVVCIDTRFYLLGRDTDLNLVQKFVMARITGVTVTGRHFERPAQFSPDDFLRTSFGAMTGNGDYEVIVQFDAWATDVMRGRHWHPHQLVVDLSEGGSLFLVRVSCLDELERWVLSWGAHATVIEPRELEYRVLQAVRAVEANYPSVHLP